MTFLEILSICVALILLTVITGYLVIIAQHLQDTITALKAIGVLVAMLQQDRPAVVQDAIEQSDDGTRH